MKYILISFAFAHIGAVIHFMGAYLKAEPFPHDFLLVLFPAFIAYAIVKHRLMDISVIANKSVVYTLLLLTSIIPAFLAITLSHKANIYSIPPLLAGTLVFACGLWIVFKNPRSTPNITFSLVCLGVCVWLFSSFMVYSSSNFEKAQLWWRINYMGVAYIPAFFYHFCATFLKDQDKNKVILTNYLISTAFLLFIPTNYLIEQPYSYYWGYYPKAGILHPVFLIYFALASGLSLRKLYLSYKTKEKSAPLESKRIKYLFWAFVMAYTASIDFIQNYGFEFYPTGYLFVSLWVIIVTYAISKYQLMDITVIITRPKIMVYMKPLALIPFYFVVLMMIRIFTGSYQYLLSGILVASFAIFARLLVSLQRQMEITVEKSFFRKKYDAYQTLTEFSKAIVSILDLEELTEKITQTLSWGMGVDRVSTFLLDEKSGYSTVSFLGLEDK
ncbi:MAG TPA: histidine kinase N-terminal 7TM domain-containing protein, partial [Candidatus Brocadiales bacterium]|nr:histidine kinase N-terminal 7TM domain-containing protein [Candidatus Brocadiales bacterium]